MNFLEQLISEWYQYRGYFVRQNIKVGKRERGGYDSELDIVALNTETNHLIHIEPSTDTDSWETREKRYKKKFELGRKYIPELFKGLQLPKKIEQQAVFLLGSKSRESIGGGQVFLVSDILKEIYFELQKKKIQNEIVPENFPLIRVLHIFIDQLAKITKGKAQINGN